MQTDPTQLREGVRKAYSAAAQSPEGKHPFPVGRDFAESVGYPPELLDRFSSEATGAFAGVSNVAISADIPPGSVVMDLGCGAGLDTLVAAERTGPGGRVLGIDFSPTMVARARAATADIEAVEIIEAAGERIPLERGSVDVALVNGIFNLNPNRESLFSELARVVRPGGVVFAAELILRAALDAASRSSSSWFA
ncbi:MAG TPA: methyltransferase domain-containing protein [Myxococcota bacterium]|nr:methyltransferase domain-containing protein [Myxococcota bacterium]